MLANHFEDKTKCYINVKYSVKMCRSVFTVQGHFTKITALSWERALTIQMFAISGMLFYKSPAKDIRSKNWELLRKSDGIVRHERELILSLCCLLSIGKCCWVKYFWTELAMWEERERWLAVQDLSRSYIFGIGFCVVCIVQNQVCLNQCYFYLLLTLNFMSFLKYIAFRLARYWRTPWTLLCEGLPARLVVL